MRLRFFLSNILSSLEVAAALLCSEVAVLVVTARLSLENRPGAERPQSPR
jgi:hypothetical protein